MRLAPSLASFFFLSTMLAAGPLGGCPGEEETCKDYTPPASFDPNTPVVSMQNDVMPIFQLSCAFTSCHGSTAGDANGVFLGGTSAASVRPGLVDVPAPELPSMPFVKPGDPRNSYLMRKLDGSQCKLDTQCKDGTCGDAMPRGEELLPVETRNIVRRWIAQGAQEN